MRPCFGDRLRGKSAACLAGRQASSAGTMSKPESPLSQGSSPPPAARLARRRGNEDFRLGTGISHIFLCDFQDVRYCVVFFLNRATQAVAEREFQMVREVAPARRRRMGAAGMILRRRRIFARLREGLSYEDIAQEEGVTCERIRQIVSDVLQKRAVDSGSNHAKLQLDRLAPVMQLAAEAVAAGDVTAIAPYLKVLDRLDRYQTVAGANQAYDDEARERLFDKINRSPPTSAWMRPWPRRRTKS
jgi:DNA-binding CsgD family transcriptional regulator